MTKDMTMPTIISVLSKHIADEHERLTRMCEDIARSHDTYMEGYREAPTDKARIAWSLALSKSMACDVQTLIDEHNRALVSLQARLHPDDEGVA